MAALNSILNTTISISYFTLIN